MTAYTVTVDTEEEWDWGAGYPTVSDSVKNIAALPRLQETCDRFGARVTYFVNHAVLVDPGGAAVIRDLASHPHVEIGFHIHPWNTPPLAPAAKVPVRDSFLHNLPQDEAFAKLDAVLDAFDSQGLRPTSFRGGRYSTSDWIQDHLYARGCIADASILPFTTWLDDGAPDFRDRDLTPRRRDMGPDKHGLWEIPLTLGFTRGNWGFWRRFYEAGQRPLAKRLRLVGIAERLWVQRVWLNLEHPLGESLDALLPVLRQMSLPCINFTMHSSSLLPGLNPYTRSDDDLRRLFERLQNALTLLGQWPEFQPATVTEVARHLESQTHAHSGN